MSSKAKDDITKMPEDAKTVLVSTFAKSFNSMPKWLRWGAIIAIIVGVFYFTVAQNVITSYHESNQIENIQNTVSSLDAKIKSIEESQADNLEVYEDLQELQKLFDLFEETERIKFRNFITFLRTTHGRKFDQQTYEKAINNFENSDFKLQKVYQEKVEDIFSSRVKKRIKERAQKRLEGK
jgi:hypothetical protein